MTSLVMCDNCQKQAADHDSLAWLSVTEQGHTLDFCTWECLLEYGARREESPRP